VKAEAAEVLLRPEAKAEAAHRLEAEAEVPLRLEAKAEAAHCLEAKARPRLAVEAAKMGRVRREDLGTPKLPLEKEASTPRKPHTVLPASFQPSLPLIIAPEAVSGFALGFGESGA